MKTTANNTGTERGYGFYAHITNAKRLQWSAYRRFGH